MVGILLIFTLLLSPGFCQYAFQTGMRADMTFGDYNDRFDVRAMLGEPKPHYYEEPDYSRRHLDYFPYLRSKGNGLSDLSLRRIGNDVNDFATHDNMVSGPEDGTQAEYERTLAKINRGEYRRKLQGIVDQLHGGERPSRRSDVTPDPEREILLHYAVPVEMKVKGYIQTPLVE